MGDGEPLPASAVASVDEDDGFSRPVRQFSGDMLIELGGEFHAKAEPFSHVLRVHRRLIKLLSLDHTLGSATRPVATIIPFTHPTHPFPINRCALPHGVCPLAALDATSQCFHDVHGKTLCSLTNMILPACSPLPHSPWVDAWRWRGPAAHGRSRKHIACRHARACSVAMTWGDPIRIRSGVRMSEGCTYENAC